MACRKKCHNVVVVSTSDDDDSDPGVRLVVEATEDELEDLPPSSDDEGGSQASSFQPSGDESELFESDDDDDRDYEQSEDDQTDKDGSGPSSPLSDSGRLGGGGDDDDDDDTLYNRVVKLLQVKRDIGNLSLKAYKAYLRRHGLRISGTKDECLMRIHEHWRIKDGKGEALYPRSSFVINCTGDVCKGDVVLFRQRVYQKFDKVSRSGKVLGSRTVAGRVVKESYGAAKQQHTFTVEVLWSKGTKNLPPLFPLLIKGRNLYRLKTFRQPWKNEAERSKALAEKHERGAAARQKRERRLLDRKMQKRRQSSDRGQSHKTHHTASNYRRDPQVVDLDRANHHDRQGKASTSANLETSTHHKRGQWAKQATAKKSTGASTSMPANRNKASTSESYNDAYYQKFHRQQVQSHHRNAQFSFPRGHVSSAFMGAPAAGYHVRHVSSAFMGAPRISSYSSGSTASLSAHQSGFCKRHKHGFFSCSTPGCKNFGSEGCAISGCWPCCRRTGIRCRVHK